MSTVPQEDERAVRRDKYVDDPGADMTADLERLASGEPLAYVIGWIPFLGVRIALDSRPLIPRPETEWWTQNLIAHARVKFDGAPFTFLDLCAGSGAIGLSILNHLPQARVTFVELIPEHAELIRKNLESNHLDAGRADILIGDLFNPVGDKKFDFIAANPPYIPESRTLPDNVTRYEPTEALFAGPQGLALIERIAEGVQGHMAPGGELWLECDIENATQARSLVHEGGAVREELCPDQYGRDRLVVSYYP